MTLIDSLLIELKLDGSDVGKNATAIIGQLRKVEQTSNKAAAETEEGWSKAGDAFAKVRREALGAFAVFTAGRSLKAFGQDVMQTNAQLGYNATALNMSAQALDRLQTRARAAGGTSAEVAQSFQAMNAGLFDAQRRPQMAQAFARLGVNDFIDPKTGQVRSDIIDRLHDAQQRQRLPAPLVREFLQSAGITGAGQVNEVLMNSQAFRENQRIGNELPTPTDQQIAQYQKLMSHIVELRADFAGLSNTELGDLAPQIDRVVQELDSWVKSGGDTVKIIANLTTMVGALTASLGPLGGALAAIVGGKVLGGLGGGLTQRLGGLVFSRLGLVGLGATAAWEATEPGGALEKKALSYTPGVGTDAQVIRWLFGDKNSSVPGLTTEQFGQYANSVAGIEHARYDQMGGAGNHYAGRYQMSQDAISEAAHRLHEPVPTQDQFLNDKLMQERFFEAYTALNGEYLQSHSDAFRSASNAKKLGILAYAHNQGAAGAAKWLQTGVSGTDAFGTSGNQYYQAVQFAMSQPAPANNNMSHSVNVNVGDIHVQTDSREPERVADAVNQSILRRLPAQAASGLQ